MNRVQSGMSGGQHGWRAHGLAPSVSDMGLKSWDGGKGGGPVEVVRAIDAIGHRQGYVVRKG